MSLAEDAIKSAATRRLARSVVIKDAEAYERLYGELQTGMTNAWSEAMREGIAQGMLSQIGVIKAATARITAAIWENLPSGARVGVSVAGDVAKVQKRASGGRYGPGWLLTPDRRARPRAALCERERFHRP